MAHPYHVRKERENRAEHVKPKLDFDENVRNHLGGKFASIFDEWSEINQEYEEHVLNVCRKLMDELNQRFINANLKIQGVPLTIAVAGPKTQMKEIHQKFIMKPESWKNDNNKFITGLEIITQHMVKCMVNLKIHHRTYFRTDDEVLNLRKRYIQKINDVLEEYDMGYRFDYETNQIIEIGSNYVYENLTKPAFELLTNKKYTSANDEYSEAHQLFKEGKYDLVATRAGSAIEGVMKIICEENGYKIGKKMGELIQELSKNGHITDNMKPAFSGLATIRNHNSAHANAKSHKKEAACALDLAATCIKCLLD